jgi:hypothetical protein
MKQQPIGEARQKAEPLGRAIGTHDGEEQDHGAKGQPEPRRSTKGLHFTKRGLQEGAIHEDISRFHVCGFELGREMNQSRGKFNLVEAVLL